MNRKFGPWSTAMSSYARAPLSAFWRERMSMLDTIRHTKPYLARREFMALGAAGLLATAVPTLRHKAEAAVADATLGMGEIQEVLRGHTDYVTSVAWLPDGQSLVSAGRAGEITLWNVETGQSRRPIDSGSSITSLAVSPDGKTVAAGSLRFVYLYDLLSGALRRKLDSHSDYWVTAVAFSPDGTRVAGGSALVARTNNSIGVTGGLLVLWDGQTGTYLNLPATDWVHTVAFSSNGRALVTGDNQGMVTLIDRESNEAKWKTKFKGSTQSVAVSPDGKWVAGGGYFDAVHLCDAETGEVRRTLGHAEWVYAVAFSPDGGTLATGDRTGTVTLWDTKTAETKRVFLGHADQVNALAFSPDGRILASAGHDATVRLWETNDG